MCRFSLPPGYTQTKPVAKPKLGALLPVIDAIIESDRVGPVKQRHTAKRIFERLRDENGFGGGYTVVKVSIGSESGPWIGAQKGPLRKARQSVLAERIWPGLRSPASADRLDG